MDELSANRIPIPADFLRQLAALAQAREGGRNFWVLIRRSMEEGPVFVLHPETGLPIVREGAEEAYAEAQRCGQEMGRDVIPYGPIQPSDRQPSLYSTKPLTFRVRRTRNDRPKAVEASVEITEGMDLLCWTPSAFDKFISPYYFSLYGCTEEAGRRVQQLKDQIFTNGSGIMGHQWPTMSTGLGEIIELKPPDQPSPS